MSDICIVSSRNYCAVELFTKSFAPNFFSQTLKDFWIELFKTVRPYVITFEQLQIMIATVVIFREC